jgi:hypothetical protein
MMDEQQDNRAGGGNITPRNLLAVALAYLGVSYLCGSATMLFSLVTGPFGSLIVGVILLFIAARIYAGRTGK